MQSTLRNTVGDFRRCWKKLALTDLLYKGIAFVLLTPLVALLLSSMMAVSGRGVVTDMGLLEFFLGPVGWICGIFVGALTVAIVAFEMAALLIVLAASKQNPVTATSALLFASSYAWPIIRVTARMAAITLAMMVPFLLIAILVYSTLLTEFDINFYLQQKPPAFLLAVGIAAVLLLALAVVLLRLATSWLFACCSRRFPRVRRCE